jgi:hypothetical protein
MRRGRRSVAADDLFFVVLYFDGFEIFGFENLPAVETLHVFDALAPGNDLGSIVIAGGLHTNALMDLFYLC